MARRSKRGDPEELRSSLIELLTAFDKKLQHEDLREQVRALVPVFHTLRDLGSSLIPEDISAGRERMLAYLKRYPQTRIGGDELMVVSGIDDWARRVRELRSQLGWQILTGVGVRQMIAVEGIEKGMEDLTSMRPDEYYLVSTEPDRDAAYRWNVANGIRRKKGAVRDKLLEFLLMNVGKPVSGEELRYVANDKTEWARRVRELRTEFGWQVLTRQDGRIDLKLGEYVLESDRQAPEHDRKIPDEVRRAVLVRDEFRCQNPTCSWAKRDALPEDYRVLELHHIDLHCKGGENVRENLLTLCDSCHDAVHAGRLSVSSMIEGKQL